MVTHVQNGRHWFSFFYSGHIKLFVLDGSIHFSMNKTEFIKEEMFIDAMCKTIYAKTLLIPTKFENIESTPIWREQPSWELVFPHHDC